MPSFCRGCEQAGVAPACGRTRKELFDAKKERIKEAKAASRNDNDAAIGGGGAALLFPKDLRLHIVHELEDGTWVCSECGHKIGVHASESTLHDTSAAPIARPVVESSLPPSTLFPLSDDNKEYVGHRVVSVSASKADGSSSFFCGTGCTIKSLKDKSTFILTCRHVVPDASCITVCRWDGRTCTKALEHCNVHYPEDTKNDVAVISWDGIEDFLPHYFSEVEFPSQTQLVYHASRDGTGLFQLSQGFANYRSSTSVCSTAFAEVGWGGGPVFHVGWRHPALVGLVQGGLEPNSCGAPLVNVQLLPAELCTNLDVPNIRPFGALAVLPPCKEQTWAYMSQMKLFDVFDAERQEDALRVGISSTEVSGSAMFTGLPATSFN